VSLVDLHVHSTASDGKFSPQAIVEKAAARGLVFIALSDHDTVDGVAAALRVAQDYPRLNVIPAVEISTDIPDGQAHILGYFIDYTSDDLASSLKNFKESRLIRAQAMIARLAEMGVKVEWQRVQEIAGEGSVGRPHIAQAMMENKYIESIKEAFEKYIGQGCPAYVERDKMTPVEAVELIVRSSGLPVLAHPTTVAEPERLVETLKPAGLTGIEAYYKDYNADEIKTLVDMANRHNLIVTGGTDYHGLDDKTEVMLGGVDVPLEAVEKLIALADKRVLKLANL
jgi:predicted metal-dependent phosphoesterase TrpH